MLDFLRKMAKLSLDRYPTTIEQDKNLLETNATLTYNQKNCIMLRIGEKEVLNEITKFCDGIEKVMDYTPKV